MDCVHEPQEHDLGEKIVARRGFVLIHLRELRSRLSRELAGLRTQMVVDVGREV